MARIKSITAREVLDSAGQPTVAAQVVTAEGLVGEASVPSGTSTGKHEAVELRDKDDKRYGGLGVQGAVKHIKSEIQAALLGKDTANQVKIDRTLLELDGTANKGKLGANAILAVSLAVARAEAASQGLPLYLYLQQLFPKKTIGLPVPQLSLLSGGRHADSGIAIQEFLLMPVGAPRFSEALRMGVEVYHALQTLLTKEGQTIKVGSEAGLAPRLQQSETAFALMTRAIELAGYVPGVDAVLGADVAASQFYDPERKQYRLDGAVMAVADLLHIYRTWRERYPIISLEDPLFEDDWAGWQAMMKTHGPYMQIAGDDLYATNLSRLKEGVKVQATNAIVVKPNQIGTLTETLQVILVAQEAGQNVIISHRSQETEDPFIADLAVATSAGQIKTGAPIRSDRTAKYNRLLTIEDETSAPLAHSLQAWLEMLKTTYSKEAVVV